MGNRSHSGREYGAGLSCYLDLKFVSGLDGIPVVCSGHGLGSRAMTRD